MPDRRILILFATKHGQTARVAERLAGQLRMRGYPVDLQNLKKLGRHFSLDRYGAVLLGGSVYAGRYQKSLRRFVAANRAQLERMPAAFFSVSLAGIAKRAGDMRAARADLERFVTETGWRPPCVDFFAGAISFTRYNLLMRFGMKLAGRSLGATDTSRDYVFTDWMAVQHFAAGFADMLEQLPTPPEQSWVPPRISPERPHV